MKIYHEFREFAIKGSAVDLAVGIVIGAAFNQVVNSLVNDILNPVLSIFTKHVDFKGLKISFFHHTMQYGLFLNTLINFIIVSFAVFLIVRQVNRMRAKSEPVEKECAYCLSKISIRATRCPNCTSQII